MAKLGKIIYEGRDAFGPLVVTEEKGMRSLYFGNDTRQSSVLLNNPGLLVIPYTEALAGTLLFHPQPTRALLIGLGGGALAHFLMHAYPECKVTAVELRQEVIKISQKFFNLPVSHRKFQVVREDALRFIKRLTTNGLKEHFDIILVDAFNSDGPASIMDHPVFLSGCKKLLTPPGVFAMNLWNRPPQYRTRQLTQLNEVFERSTFSYYLGKTRGSTIVYGFKKNGRAKSLKDLSNSAKKLNKRFDIDYVTMMREISYQNFSFWKRCKHRIYAC